ncbi:MAG: Stage IV sporulation protein B [Brockia lithotrophica]|uniref:Stage IV sporulation protein B n=1 Tax=Brockia lithotrophica TaxID=933949 RepID=A0A2T5G658_9BACL|nr:MAG: Stage IV sporulation protein B [Brockia lithotrophica]
MRWNRVSHLVRSQRMFSLGVFALILPLLVLAHAFLPVAGESISAPAVLPTFSSAVPAGSPATDGTHAFPPPSATTEVARVPEHAASFSSTPVNSPPEPARPSQETESATPPEALPPSSLRVHPGGISLGIKLQDEGLLVVGIKKIPTNDGHLVSPGEEARIHVGDRILMVDSVALERAELLGELVERAGAERRPLTLLVRSGEKVRTVQVHPVLDPEDNRYKLGLYVRDGASGIGTLTFVDPVSKRFAALGHVILDQDTREPIVPRGGSVSLSTVVSVERGAEGKPGAIRAIFSDGEKIGNVEENTDFGVFGTLDRLPEEIAHAPLVSLARVNEIAAGPAEILTVVEGRAVERFQIEVEGVDRERRPTTKGIVFRVTDPRLVERTGGIVQGMSGSPILQNGKLVGAVTHVFVGDPRKGYGVAAEWMWERGGFAPPEK